MPRFKEMAARPGNKSAGGFTQPRHAGRSSKRPRADFPKHFRRAGRSMRKG